MCLTQIVLGLLMIFRLAFFDCRSLLVFLRQLEFLLLLSLLLLVSKVWLHLYGKYWCWMVSFHWDHFFGELIHEWNTQHTHK